MNLTKDQIKNRFWQSKDILGLEPDAITFSKEYKDEKSLSLFITQLTYHVELSRSDAQKLVKEWIDILPRLNSVKNLWVKSMISQEIFDSICQMENIEILHIKYFKGKSINNLTQLKNLKHLSIYMPSVESIEILSKLTQLKTLQIRYPKKISDFSTLKSLENLEGLEIHGSMYNNQKIENLEFLKTLKNLIYLTLMSTQIKSKNLDPVLELENLELFMSGLNLPKKEYKKLLTMNRLDKEFLESAIKYKS